MKRPPWALLVALLVGVTLAVYGLARWQPFEAGAPAAALAPPGDAARGEAIFARSCAVCHGTAAEGGVGPALAGSGLGAGQVIAVIAAGRGVMPAGIVSGQEAADVAAHVAAISGATTGAATTPTVPEAAAGSGTATFVGVHADGLSVRLDQDAPADWTVWVEATAGRRAVARIPAGQRVARVPSVDGQPLLGRYDSVLVGADPEAPALSGALAPGRTADLLRLLISDPNRPGAESALESANGQVAILRDHVRFLVAARDEGNLANVRFHGEHMVNITRGRPLRDVDGNGDPSTPGDGRGLIVGRDAHFPRIASLAGPALAPVVGDLSALAARIAAAGERCGTTATVDGARPAIAAIERADAHLDAAWQRLRARAARAAVLQLEPR